MEKAVNTLQQLFLLALLQKQAEFEETKALLNDFVYLMYLSEIANVENLEKPLNYTDPTGLETIIANTPARGLAGSGHSAIAMGNDDDGYMFYSYSIKNDQGKFEYNEGQKFDTKADLMTYLTNQDGQKTQGEAYNRFLTLDTTTSQEADMIKQLTNVEFKKMYNLDTHNCSDAVVNALTAGLGEDFTNNAKNYWFPHNQFDALVKSAEDFGLKKGLQDAGWPSGKWMIAANNRQYDTGRMFSTLNNFVQDKVEQKMREAFKIER